MKTGIPWPHILLLAGLAGLVGGALDPLEGSLVILPALCLATLGAYLGKSRHRKLLFASAALVAAGVGALWALSAVGGFGGDSGRSMGWGLLLLPYPIGWILGVVLTIRALADTFRHPTTQGA